MTDFQYILEKAKLFHYKGWEEGELQKCLGMLPTLSREELVKLYRSKWINEKSKLRQSIFNILFKETVGKREERIKNLEIDALIEEFKDKKSGNVALIRKEMRERYKANKDRMKIAAAFNNSTKTDQQWVTSQIRKERYSNTDHHFNQCKK